MPKKSASARGNAQRNRAKLQKNIQLVRPVSATAESESEINEEVESTSAVATTTAPSLVADVEEEEATEEAVPTPAREPAKRARSSRASDASTRSATSPVAPASHASSTPAAPGSASARLAARRQQQQQPVQKTRQSSLVTAEHYAYVRRDLIFIAILAILMFGTLVVLHFVPAIGG